MPPLEQTAPNGRRVEPTPKCVADAQRWWNELPDAAIVAAYEKLQNAWLNGDQAFIKPALKEYLALLATLDAAPFPPCTAPAREQYLAAWACIGNATEVFAKSDLFEYIPLLTLAARSIGQARGYLEAIGVTLWETPGKSTVFK